MTDDLKNTANNESGFVMVVCILVLAIISLAGVAAINTTRIEGEIVNNDQIFERNFYTTESGLIEAVAQSQVWLSTNILLNPLTKGIYLDVPVTDNNGNVIDTVSIFARAIFNSTNNINVWLDTTGGAAVYSADTTAANSVPTTLDHISSDPINSGSSAANKFEIRRYAITASSGNISTQYGGYKIFNKF